MSDRPLPFQRGGYPPLAGCCRNCGLRNMDDRGRCASCGTEGNTPPTPRLERREPRPPPKKGTP
jgi:hypothetical protein